MANIKTIKTENNIPKVNKKVSQFEIIGTAIVDDSTFTIEESFESSGWTRNKMSLGIKTGDDIVKVDLDGGYFPKRGDDWKVYANTKKLSDDGEYYMADYDNPVWIPWSLRKDPIKLAEVHDSSFKQINLDNERDKDKRLVFKKFVSGYDAVIHLKENLKDGMKIRVTGSLVFNNFGMTKEIERVTLAYDDAKDKNFFKQTFVIDESECKFQNDKKGVVLNAYAIDRVNKTKIDGVKYEVKENFMYPVDLVFCPTDDKTKIDSKVIKIAEGFCEKLVAEDKKEHLTRVDLVGKFGKTLAGGNNNTEDDSDILNLDDISLDSLENGDSDVDYMDLLLSCSSIQEEEFHKPVGNNKTYSKDLFYAINLDRKKDNSFQLDTEFMKSEDICFYSRLVDMVKNMNEENSENNEDDDLDKKEEINDILEKVSDEYEDEKTINIDKLDEIFLAGL